jgi:murein DD-endopeptidase MepM/ murein hydrolase activator NlpD
MIPELSSAAAAPTKTAAKEAAAQVQSMFVEIMLKAMEEAIDAEDGLFGNSASSDIYRGMLRQHLATAISGAMKSPLEDALTAGVTPLPHEDSSSFRSNGQPVDGVVTSPEGWRRDPVNGEMRYHSGTDIAAPEGTPIRAVAGGRVVESGPKGSYGNAVVILTEDGRKMLYAHNSQNLVRTGDWVSTGQTIAAVGSTGRATGPHVHFEVKF